MENNKGSQKSNYILWGGFIVLVILFIVSRFWSGDSTIQPTQNISQQFNPNLVKAKQDCQDTFQKMKLGNTWSTADGGLGGLQAHFNSQLNTCLVEFEYAASDRSGSQVYAIADIYENRRLLELDLILGSGTVASGEYLFENGVKVNISNPSAEYDKRRAVLFNQ